MAQAWWKGFKLGLLILGFASLLLSAQAFASARDDVRFNPHELVRTMSARYDADRSSLIDFRYGMGHYNPVTHLLEGLLGGRTIKILSLTFRVDKNHRTYIVECDLEDLPEEGYVIVQEGCVVRNSHFDVLSVESAERILGSAVRTNFIYLYR